MSEYADKHSKSHRKERVDHILAVDPKSRIDASGYTPPDPLNASEKTGPCKPKARAYAKGGKVEGDCSHKHAGRKSRDAGGQAKKPGMTPDELRARYAKGKAEWNKKTPEQQHTETKAWLDKVQKPSVVDTRGDWKRGGRAHRDSGGNIVNQLRPQVPTSGLYGNGFSPTHSGVLAQGAGLKKGGEAKKRAKGGEVPGNSEVTGTRPTGGRLARKDGGKAKGKTNINIIIGAGAGGGDKPPVPPPPSAMPPKPAIGPMGGLPPAAMGGPGMGGAPGPGMPPQMPPQMPRARGGRTYPIDTASGGGEARLEKPKAYGA